MKLETNLKPTGTKLLCKRIKAQLFKTKHIVTPLNWRKLIPEALVLKIGDDYSGPIKKGDRILYDQYQGEVVEHEDEEWFFLPSEDAIAVLGDE